MRLRNPSFAHSRNLIPLNPLCYTYAVPTTSSQSIFRSVTGDTTPRPIFAPIPEILDDLRAGRLIVLVDDERRENEGDLICAAERITPELVNFMVRTGGGYLCLALAGDDCDRLDAVASVHHQQ